MSPPILPAAILAAGMSRRMGGDKLLIPLNGRPLIDYAVTAALASRADPVMVVTGHHAEAVRAALPDAALRFVDNPDYAEGLASSLRRAVAAAGEADGLVICLGDMPLIRADHIDALLDAFAARPDAVAVVPRHGGRRGHPVLLGRALFPAVADLRGDVGARSLLTGAGVVEVPMADDAILRDADTPEALRRLAAERFPS